MNCLFPREKLENGKVSRGKALEVMNAIKFFSQCSIFFRLTVERGNRTADGNDRSGGEKTNERIYPID